jgi:hypothetical protein
MDPYAGAGGCEQAASPITDSVTKLTVGMHCLFYRYITESQHLPSRQEAAQIFVKKMKKKEEKRYNIKKLFFIYIFISVYDSNRERADNVALLTRFTVSPSEARWTGTVFRGIACPTVLTRRIAHSCTT